jgi:hypothetical protein
MFSMSRSSRLQSRFIRPHAAGSWDGLASGSNDRGGMISRTLALAAVLLGGIYNFSGDDPNLNNDRFEGAHTRQTVGIFTTTRPVRGASSMVRSATARRTTGT